jgi:hypothetical protein
VTATATATAPAGLRASRAALVVSALARTALGALALLVLVSVVPAVAGWESTVVTSGSMAPSVRPGDVTLVRPVDVAALVPGQVLLVDDPDVPGGLRLHRLAAVTDSGLLQLKGDANATADASLVDPSAVHGVGALRLPDLGLPALWAAERRSLPLSGAALALAALIGLALLHRSDDDDEPGDDPPVTGGPTRRPGRRRFLRTAVRGTTAALAVAVLVPTTAAAVFSGSTANHANTFAAVPNFTCIGPAASPAAQYLALQETRGPTAVNDGTFTADATYTGAGVTYRVPGPPCSRADRAVALDGSSGFVYTSIRVSNPSPFSTQLWFRTTTARGGYLIGFGNGTNGDTSTSRDRLVYMTNDGRLTFGVYDGAAKTISSAQAYNDGAWHMVTATFSASAGAALYVDGAQVAADATLTRAESVSGLFRAGYDNLSGWPNAPTSNWFAGSIAHMGVFVTALSAADVAKQYATYR